MITQEKQRKILLRTSGALGSQPLKVLRLKFFCGYNIQNKLCDLIFLKLESWRGDSRQSRRWSERFDSRFFRRILRRRGTAYNLEGKKFQKFSLTLNTRRVSFSFWRKKNSLQIYFSFFRNPWKNISRLKVRITKFLVYLFRNAGTDFFPGQTRTKTECLDF